MKELTTAVGGTKSAILAMISAHPVLFAVTGAALIGGGAYYLGRRQGLKRKQVADQAQPATEAEAPASA